MKHKVLLMIFLLLLFGNVHSQVISFKASVNKNSIVIGEPVDLKLEVVIPASRIIQFPFFDSLPHFEVLHRHPVDSIASFSGLRLEQVVVITSWDSGSWFLPSLALLNARTEPIKMEVGYSPMDPDQEYHDIKDILDVPKPQRPNWYWYVLLFALLLLLFRLFFPGSKGGRAEKKVLTEDPYKKAMRNLSALDANTESKIFFTGLVQVLREYLSEKKDIRSFSKTTGDLVVRLKDLSVGQEQHIAIAQVLKLADLAKYAKFDAASEEKTEASVIVKQYISAIEKN